MTLPRFGKLALMLTALIVGNAVLYIMVSGSATRFADRQFGIKPAFESGERMLLEMLAVVLGLVVMWSLGALRSFRSILLAELGVVAVAAAMPLIWP
jgi:cadmium resistance protein CadD (predicted permease)